MAFMPPDSNAAVPPETRNATIASGPNDRSGSTPTHGVSPRSRRSTASNPSQGSGVKPLEFKAAMRDFSTMFPTLDADTIEMVLRSNNGAVDATIDQLLEMCDSLGLNNSNETQSTPQRSAKESPRNQLAVDSVDSYNMHLASVTPPKNPESLLTDSSMYANIPFQEAAVTAAAKDESKHSSSSKSVATSYRYQTALYKFNNPFLGPLPDDFLRIRNDAAFDRDMQYSKTRSKQVEDIKNERLRTTHYTNDGAFHPENDFGQIVGPVPEEAKVSRAWSTDLERTGSPPNGPVANPSTGAIPKNYNKSWSGTARNTISTFGKKLTMRNNSNERSSTLGANPSTNLGKNKGVTPSTMNLLGDLDDEDDATDNLERDEDLLTSLGASGGASGVGTLYEDTDEESGDQNWSSTHNRQMKPSNAWNFASHKSNSTNNRPSPNHSSIN